MEVIPCQWFVQRSRTEQQQKQALQGGVIFARALRLCRECIRKQRGREQQNCSLSHHILINVLHKTTNQSPQKTTSPHHTLRNKDILVLFPFAPHMDQKWSPQYKALHFHMVSGYPQESEYDSTRSFFPLSTLPIKMLQFLSLVVFPSNCWVCQLELDSWDGEPKGHIFNMISWIPAFPMCLFALRNDFLYIPIHILSPRTLY